MATKRRVEVRTNVLAHNFMAAAPQVTVIDEKSGNVTALDKAKRYYKGLIVLIGSFLVMANELTPVLNFLPDNGKQWVSGAIGVATVVLTFLKANETWIEGL
ncbi:hypothetical protein EI067_30755 [Mycobacterium paragordonae]|uniref:hypothetical protein n=1 Tax=Mycobacterium paragordonae TaxID=1389713 RepID=UPI00105ECF29|nr:hypothetical protein [Mycobacterium paragordonae]TDK85745.1 hypothetical protein EI067_30755 [Mycobacterium paragordonae]